jgi:hypothetical protein
VKRLIAGGRLQKCNSLQIEGVEQHSFRGLPYARVCAYSRHAQKVSAFSSE